MEGLLIAAIIFQHVRKHIFTAQAESSGSQQEVLKGAGSLWGSLTSFPTPPHFPHDTFVLSPTTCHLHGNLIYHSLHQRGERVAIPEKFRMDTAQRKTICFLASEHLFNLFTVGFYITQGFYGFILIKVFMKVSFSTTYRTNKNLH